MKRMSLLILFATSLLVPARGQTPDQKSATIMFLRGLQGHDGGFVPAPPNPGTNQSSVSTLRATSAALRGLKYFGGEPVDRELCAKFVRTCFDQRRGAFADQPGGKPDVISTAVGIMALVELKIASEPYAGPSVKYLGDNAKTFEEIRLAAAGLESLGAKSPRAGVWLEQIARMRNPDGTFGQGTGLARDTGGAAAAMLRLGSKIDHEEQVIQAIKAGQRHDGGFGKEGVSASDLETSYRVVRALRMLKEKPDAGAMRAFVAKCRNSDGGYGVAIGQPSSAAATYFASILLHWLDE